MNEDQILDALYNVGHSHDVESAVRGLLASAWDEGYGAGQKTDRAAALADMTNDEADAVDRFMGEHMYRHSISNNINGMSCGVGCRTRALAEAFRREVLIPRRADRSES